MECAERGLDPLDANLVVTDEIRTDKTICLAVSPSLKEKGVPGRARLFEAKQRLTLQGCTGIIVQSWSPWKAGSQKCNMAIGSGCMKDGLLHY